MSPGVPICGPRRDNVTYPPEPSACSNPNSRSYDQPEDPSKYLAVVDLTYARDEKAQNRRDAWVSHFASA